MAVTSATSDFKRSFEKLSYRHSYSDTFNHFLDFSLYMLNVNRGQKEFEEVKYLNNIYSDQKEAEEMASLYNSWSIMADNDGAGFYDALGDIFMEFVSHGRNGQFFTPQPICDVMAQITHGDNLKPGMTVCDPAAGSGRTLLAMARIERRLKFYAADNDLTCCKMAVMNMVINSMEGEVAWMDTLRMEHYRSWHIKNVRIGTHHLPVFHVTGKNETAFVERLKETIANQPPTKDKGKINQLTLF